MILCSVYSFPCFLRELLAILRFLSCFIFSDSDKLMEQKITLSPEHGDAGKC